MLHDSNTERKRIQGIYFVIQWEPVVLRCVILVPRGDFDMGTLVIRVEDEDKAALKTIAKDVGLENPSLLLRAVIRALRRKGAAEIRAFIFDDTKAAS
jgi:hypothetical protein